MTTKETLLASLEAVGGDKDSLYLDDGRYFDWGYIHDGERQFELGDGDEAVQVMMSRAEMVQLHAALTRTLLADVDA